MSDDNIHYLRAKGESLTPMTQAAWGQEMVKTFLISMHGVPAELVDGRVSAYTDQELEFVAGVAMRALEEAVKIIDSGELEAKLAEIKEVNDND